MLLIIDNYDSFTYNLYQAIAAAYSPVQVVRNDQLPLEAIANMQPKAIVISPGPGRPEDAGICIDLIRTMGDHTPILGVCLGHQAIGAAFDAKISRCTEIMHGKESLIYHNGNRLFQGVESPFKAGRYHSLLVNNLPAELIVDAKTADGLVMAMHHRDHPLYGVQFHPESILTPDGNRIIKNFLEMSL